MSIFNHCTLILCKQTIIWVLKWKVILFVVFPHWWVACIIILVFASSFINSYPQMNEVDFLLACPFCRDICNCKSCLRLELREKVCFFDHFNFNHQWIHDQGIDEAFHGYIYNLAIYHFRCLFQNETRISEEAKKHYSKYLLRRLLPFVKQIDVEQSLEKEMEAQIRGTLQQTGLFTT